LGDASGGALFARCIPRRGQESGPGAGNSMDLGGHPAAVTASDGAPNGDALVWWLWLASASTRLRMAGRARRGGIEAREGLAVGGEEGNAPLGDGDEGSEGHGVSMPQLSCGTGGRLRTSRGCGHPGIKRATRAVEAVAGGRRSVARYSKTIAGCLVWRAAYE